MVLTLVRDVYYLAKWVRVIIKPLKKILPTGRGRSVQCCWCRRKLCPWRKFDGNGLCDYTKSWNGCKVNHCIIGTGRNSRQTFQRRRKIHLSWRHLAALTRILIVTGMMRLGVMKPLRTAFSRLLDLVSRRKCTLIRDSSPRKWKKTLN